MSADPDGDGSLNLLEYGLRLDPKTASTLGLPVMQFVVDHLELRYTRRLDVSDLAYVVQVSSDLSLWVAGPDYTEQLSAVNHGDGTETVTVRDLYTTETNRRRFIRLAIGIDSDQDGMPDDWEMRMFGDLSHFATTTKTSIHSPTSRSITEAQTPSISTMGCSRY